MKKREFWLIVATVAYTLFAVQTYEAVSPNFCQDGIFRREGVAFLEGVFWPVAIVVNGAAVMIFATVPFDCPKR
mgnify:CR=1 FL=1